MELSVGVIENNVDPEKLGRCQVRIFGMHPDDRDEYPTDDLPWAVILTSTSNVADQGSTFTLENGDFVAVGFFDPEKQKPVVLGSFARFVNATPDFTVGFSDPNGVNPDSGWTGESTIPRLARNENIDQTIIQDKKDNRTTGVDCAGTTWDEPETQYAAEYPHNKVIKTRHHVIEMDDTDGAERVHVHHKSGSSIEIHPNGDAVVITKGSHYDMVEGDYDEVAKGDRNCRSENGLNVGVGGAMTTDVGGAMTTDVGGAMTTDVGGAMTTDVGGAMTTDVDGAMETTVASTITVSATGNITITSTGTVTVQGSSIALN
jgi:hypothetical protein